MRYTVVWSDPALAQLADLWTNAPDRQAVTEAANAIDRELARDPAAKGSPAQEGFRTLDIPPLHSLYAVDEPDRIVRVVLVRRLSPLGGPQTNGHPPPASP